MKQKDAVYQAIKSVFSDNGVHFEDGMDVQLMFKENPSYRDAAHAIVTEGFTSGTIELSDTPENKAKLSNSALLSSYVSGLISNWCRKDSRLNGNTKYSPKNPGSRVGSTDPELKALRALAKQFQGVDTEKFEKITAEIDRRVSTIQAERAKKVEIDYSVLPADLLEDLGLEA